MDLVPTPFAFTKRPSAARCTPERWDLAECCSPAFAWRTDLRKWGQLLIGLGVNLLTIPRPWQVGYVYLVETLSVAAFISSIRNWKKRAGVLDIGMNVGFYTRGSRAR